MKPSKIHKLSEIAGNYDLIMFDLWGVLVEGNGLYEGVRDVVNDLIKKKQVLFVSNAPRLRHYSAEIMRNFGIKCKDEQMFTSGQMSRDLIDADKGQIIYHLSNGNLPHTIEDNCTLTDDIAKATVMLITAQVDEDQDLGMFDDVLNQALERDLLCVCSNPDKIITNKDKNRYCAGYFAEKYEKMGGKVAIIGKPGKDIFIQAMDSLESKPSLDRVLMIGDTVDTDILGAQNTGIHSALVMTGNSTRVTAGYDGIDAKIKALVEFCESQGVMPTMLLDLV